jgi:hypothetical protein
MVTAVETSEVGNWQKVYLRLQCTLFENEELRGAFITGYFTQTALKVYFEVFKMFGLKMRSSGY